MMIKPRHRSAVLRSRNLKTGENVPPSHVAGRQRPRERRVKRSPQTRVNHIPTLQPVSRWPVCSFPVSWPLTPPRCSSHFRPNQQLWAGVVPPPLLSVCSCDCSVENPQTGGGAEPVRDVPPLPPPLKKAGRNHRLTPKKNEISDEFRSRRESSSAGEIFWLLERSICLTPTLLSVDPNLLAGWVSNVWTRTREHGDGKLWCKQSRWENKKINNKNIPAEWGVCLSSATLAFYALKARGTQDIELDWLGLTPLMWAAEGVRPHLDRMMKFRLYLYPHATLHHCRYDSPRSICFQPERGRWIVMHLRWPACKHSYVADHVAPLMHVKYLVRLFGAF